MLCGCSKQKKRLKGHSPEIADRSGYGLLEDIPECNGVEISDSWCPVLKCDHSQYPRMPPGKCVTPMQNQGFDSGIDTGSSPDSGHSQAVKVLDPYGSMPVLEVCDKGSTSDLSHRTSRMYQSYRGQIKLSVYLNSGLLTLHVRKAKHLTSRWTAIPCSYVKVALAPEGPCKTHCRTKKYIDQNRPQYDEKLSFEIGEEDFTKRLMVSVWSKDPNHHRSELLGCTSFGVNNIVRGKTTVHGWYFLLSENVGRRKHLLAHNKRHLVVDKGDWPCAMSDYTSCSEYSEGPHQPILPHSSVLRLSRGANGYGFTLSGGCPSTVFTIEPGSPADVSGMRIGDCVLAINAQDVSRATADTVARIVRFYPDIRIEVQSHAAPTPRPTPPPWCGSPVKRNDELLRSTPLTHLSRGGTSSSSNSHSIARHS